MKERVKENETVGTLARRGGEGEKKGRVREGRGRVREKEKGGMVFVNPSTSGFY